VCLPPRPSAPTQRRYASAPQAPSSKGVPQAPSSKVLEGLNPTRERQMAAMPNPQRLQKLMREQKKFVEEAEDSQEVYVNPKTGEIGGPKGPEPTRHNDWAYKGRCTDF